MKTIILKFAEPLQSWGTRSHFEIRHTDRHPSKSAVIGLIASALGYRREEKDKIQNLQSLRFAVRVDQEGSLLDDYQTAHKYKYSPDKKLDRTYVTHREYLEDAVFVVAIGSEDDLMIDEIVQALRSPCFPLFAGRRSCPLLANTILDCMELDVAKALSKVPWQAAEWYRKKLCTRAEKEAGSYVRLWIYADEDIYPESERGILRRDVPVSFSSKKRSFIYRREHKIEFLLRDNQTMTLQEHDAFSAI